MNSDVFLVLIFVPAFVIGVQKYIEVRASYSPPTDADIRNVEKVSGAKIAWIVKAIPKIRVAILYTTILLLYIFGFTENLFLKWSAVGGVAICVVAMSALVNWHLAYDA